MIVIHLGFHMKAEKKGDKKDARKKKKKSTEEESDKDREETDTNQIVFNPDINKVEAFLKKGMKMIIDSTNKISNLEIDLMPFLKNEKEKTPNF